VEPLPQYSTDVDGVCQRCLSTAAFELANPNVVLIIARLPLRRRREVWPKSMARQRRAAISQSNSCTMAAAS